MRLQIRRVGLFVYYCLINKIDDEDLRYREKFIALNIIYAVQSW